MTPQLTSIAKPVEPVVLFLRPTHSVVADPRTGAFEVVVKPAPVVRA